MPFEPIAVIGQSCILPGALNPAELWEEVLAGTDLLTKAPDGYWRIDPKLVAGMPRDDARDICWTDKGGYVRGFDALFEPDGFAIPKEEIGTFDTLVKWVLHTSREALKDAGYLNNPDLNIGSIFGNLSYPSHSLSEFAESTWLNAQGSDFYGGKSREIAGVPTPHPLNRFMSGLPAHIVARALGLRAGSFAVDAACASSLFALKLACDKLHDRKADIMLAGGVNRADDLIIHIGFCTLQAMSHTGQSRPFHKDADGLVPCEGAGMVALKRLDDAVADGDNIHAVIRSIGLSNDGKGHGLLVPSEDGQYRAMKKAYDISGIKPSQVSLLECHATGTIVGDSIEVRSTSRIFEGVKDIPVGTIKSNMGHPITASGIAGLIKVMGAMKAGIRPPTLHVEETLDALEGTPLRVLKESEPWQSDGPKMAGISNFGFGGNNAHVIVEEWDSTAYKKSDPVILKEDTEIALVGMGAMVASGNGVVDFAKTVFSGKPALSEQEDGSLGGVAGAFDLPLMGLRFFPAALDQTLPQQLLMLKAGLEAVDDVKVFPNKNAGAFVGMGCDGEVTRSGMCWRMPQFVVDWLKTDEITDELKEWIETTKDQINPAREASAIVGAMPNIVGNRLSSQFDLEGQSFTVSSEELSGVRCLEAALRALRANELDAALVGAVDLSCETVHMAAVRETLDNSRQLPGDAAIALVLKRADDARRDGDKIYALFSDAAESEPDLLLGLDEDQNSITPLIGHSHVASGLLHIAAAALACHYRAQPSKQGSKATSWITTGERSARVTTNAMLGESSSTDLHEDTQSSPGHLLLKSVPRLHIYSGKDRNEVLKSLELGNESDDGPARLVLVAENEAQLADLKDQAKPLLDNGKDQNSIRFGKGIYFHDHAIEGELGFVYTGFTGMYPEMGRDLVLALPELYDDVTKKVGHLEGIVAPLQTAEADMEQMLWKSSFLSQIQTVVSRDYWGLKPQAALGFSSGESSSLFAMGAWRDMGQMAVEFHDMGIFTRQVGGEFNVIKKAWEPHGVSEVNWQNWGILAPVDEVRQALESEPLCHLTIINSPEVVVIGGQDEACARVIEKVGQQRAQRLEYSIANHCPEVSEYTDDWIKLHKRKTYDVPGVRFYTGDTCSHYKPTSQSAAKAILGMAVHELNFPLMVENAWNDGVRIFVEHGPRGRCSRLIRTILGDKEHLAVSMDHGGRSSLKQAIHAMAQLKSAGVPVNHQAFFDKIMSSADIKPEDSTKKGATRTYYIHPPKIELQPVTLEKKAAPAESPLVTDAPSAAVDARTAPGDAQILAPPPSLPPAMGGPGVPPPLPTIPPASSQNVPMQRPQVPAQEMPSALQDQIDTNSVMGSILKEISAQNSFISSIHQEFLAKQKEIHQRYLDHRQNALSVLTSVSGTEMMAAASQTQPGQAAVPYPVAAPPPPQVAQGLPPAAPSPEALPQPEMPPTEALDIPLPEAPPPSIPDDEEIKIDVSDPIAMLFANPKYIEPNGPTYSKEQLEILASGKISDVFGPMFEIQDDYPRQVRVPEYPLLLADRITGLQAEPGSMEKGIIWTETDVRADAWYIGDIYMPAGVTVESGQCDLTLISYLGADFQNMGERVYRLLGCDLMYYGEPPRVGDTLCYQIHVDGHANLGDTRIFFFRYDCRIRGEMRLSVRNAQAGFFTDDELAASGGVLWEPETGEHKPDDEAIVTPPPVECIHNKFSKEQIKALSEGDVYECFGPGFEIAQTQSKPPRIPPGMMRLLDEVTEFDPKGGPWKRGYLRVENQIPSDAWYLTCHFKNDPCMPGTLMSDACLQTLAFYLIAAGFALNKDGWRFDPVPEQVMNIKCRGQVTPKSKHLIYETFIEEIEIVDGLYPTVYADILATCDGLKILHIRRMGVRLIPDWPLDCWPHILEGYKETRPVAKVGDMEFGYKSLLSCAWGKPSDAFGDLATVFDKGRHISRLPSPPYHFMTRVSKIDATMGGAKKDETIQVEYDVPPDEWYFTENGHPTMPYSIIMEVGLQPSGWLAVFEGGPGSSEESLYFRNLDGTATLKTEIIPTTGIMRTTTTLTNIARIAGVTLVNFDVTIDVNDEVIFEMKTGFGFFPAEALSQQLGLGASENEIAWLDEPNDFFVDLTKRPERYCNGNLRLANPMLLMIDRVTGYWPDANGKGLPRLRSEKTVNPREWYFKAHFFHDPVQPGSLGVEAIIQTLQFFMIHENMHEGMKHPHFQPIALNTPITWKYRGQITIDKKRSIIEMNVLDKGKDETGVWVRAEAWYWTDTLRIYHIKDLKVYIVEGDPSPPPRLEGVKKGEDKPETGIPPVGTAHQGDAFEKEAIDKVASMAGIAPRGVTLTEDRTAAACNNMPFSLYPVTKKEDSGKGPQISVGEPYLNFDKMLAYGRKIIGCGPWVGEKFTQGLCKQFTRHLILEDPDAYERVKGQSLLYLGNHQVQVESVIFPTMIQVLGDRRISTIASAEHLKGWLGLLDKFIYAYPGVDYPKNIVYFDQNDRQSMFKIIDDFKANIKKEGISVFLHAEGKLGLSCRHGVKNLSSVFIDLAEECNLPIVPVRFVGGLPVQEMETTLDFPLGYGRQDYYLGKPILVEDIKKLPYAERRRFVMNAINNLGPSPEVEEPLPPNIEFEQAIKNWMKGKDVIEAQAVVFKTLESVTDKTDEIAMALIDRGNGKKVTFNNDEIGRWLEDVAQHLCELKL